MTGDSSNAAVSRRPEEGGLLAHMRKRGYDTDSPWAIVRRLFFESWAEPGFHRFWRVWNPVYGYGLLRLYVALGGRRRPLSSTVGVFLFCGFVLHDLPSTLLSGHLQLGTTVAFLVYALVAVANRRLEPTLGQDRWPTVANVLVNLAFVALGLAAGVTLGAGVTTHL